MLQLEDVAAGYGRQTVLREATLTLRPGERIGVLGRNGAGKSTLIKLLAGELAPQAGVRRAGRGLAIGYFAQHQLEQLRPDESPLQHLLRLEPATREQELRDYLGGFDFGAALATAPCGAFSGGEKSRLALALVIRGRPNLLLLDEPTNHLDLEMREALTLALAEYDGAVVLVSHDRHLLRTTVDALWLVAGGRLRPFDGDLDDYRDWLAAQEAGTSAPDKAARRAERCQAQAGRQALLARRRPLARELERIEAALAQWQAEHEELETRLADPAAYTAGGRRRLDDEFRRQAELARLIEEAEERWLSLHDELERIGAPQ